MKDFTNRQLENAKRLAYGMQQSATPQALAQLAHVLNYNKEQLAIDIQDLCKVLQEVRTDEE